MVQRTKAIIFIFLAGPKWRHHVKPDPSPHNPSNGRLLLTLLLPFINQLLSKRQHVCNPHERDELAIVSAVFPFAERLPITRTTFR